MSKNMSQEEANLEVATALMREAMDLRAEVQRLQACAEALEKIANSPTNGVGCNPAEMVKVARAALDALEDEEDRLMTYREQALKAAARAVWPIIAGAVTGREPPPFDSISDVDREWAEEVARAALDALGEVAGC